MKKCLFIFVFLLLGRFSHAQVNKAQDDSMIRASRIRTNELIADHDLKGLSRYWLRDYVRIAGNGNISIGKDSAMAYWAKSFKDQPTISYVRTPTEIIISENGMLAWENGTWIGVNTKSKGGNYAAMWAKQDNIWKLQSELYVTLYYY
jgi:ketosteroid isomerase-like protein